MSKCLYCGGTDFYVGQDEDGDLKFAVCQKCHATGPTFDVPWDCIEDDPVDIALNEKALAAFCNPAYLLNVTGLIRLAADEVVVKRATAETAYSWVRGFGGSLGMIHDDFDAVADLERALEGRG